MEKKELTYEEGEKIVREISKMVAKDLKAVTEIRKIFDKYILIKLEEKCSNYGEVKLLISEIQREHSWGHKDSTIGERLMRILDEEMDCIELSRKEE